MRPNFDLEKYNEVILDKISNYLNFNSRMIDGRQVKEVSQCGVGDEVATRLLLASYIDADEILEKEYLTHMLKRLDKVQYQCDAYYKNINFHSATNGKWQLKTDRYEKYEIFVRDDFEYIDGKVLPQLGYFEEEFFYPAVFQDGVLWMSVTPNEINTMSAPIAKAKGRVLTFGLGLGYFAYMCLQKHEVESITVIERDQQVIDLFTQEILPQFPRRDSITIVRSDAFDFLSSMSDSDFDYVFVDIYHDAGDGREVYLKFKEHEGKFKCTKFDYWIEKTIKYYL